MHIIVAGSLVSQRAESQVLTQIQEWVNLRSVVAAAKLVTYHRNDPYWDQRWLLARGNAGSRRVGGH
jgi:hypothetical protein